MWIERETSYWITVDVSLIAEWSWTPPKLPVESWWFFGVVLVLLIISIWMIARLVTSTSDDIDPAEIDRQMLTAVNELHSDGELTPDEYRSIKGRLVERLSDRSSSEESVDSSDEGKQAKGSEAQPHKTTEVSRDPLGEDETTVESSTRPSDGYDSTQDGIEKES